ncbi:MAG: internal scaffolding protein [Microvirus sp.]|nr:MAG: internal scaffolding protein [Microvirus sp.]
MNNKLTNKETNISANNPDSSGIPLQNTQLFLHISHFINAYGPKRKVALTFPAQGRTKQSFKEECDINTIMNRFSRTGVLPVTNRTPTYGDIADLDFQGAMDLVAAGREMFAALPSKVRERFANDPAKLLQFVQDPENGPEARKLGLLAPDVPSPQATPQNGVATPSGQSSGGSQGELPKP